MQGHLLCRGGGGYKKMEENPAGVSEDSCRRLGGWVGEGGNARSLTLSVLLRRGSTLFVRGCPKGYVQLGGEQRK